MKNLEKLAEKKLEQILADGGYVELDKLKIAANESQVSGKTVDTILLEKGFIDESTFTHALCTELQLPFLSLENHPVSADLIQEIPKSLMVKYQFIPLDRFDNILCVLVGTTFSLEMITEIQTETQTNLFIYIGLPSQLRKTIDEYITEEEQEAINTEVIPEDAQVTAGWESIFDVADQAVMDELKQKAIDSGLHSVSSTNVGGSSASQQYSGAYTKEVSGSINAPDAQKQELIRLAQRLMEDPFDYDAVNQYVAISLALNDKQSAINQLLLFARGLKQNQDMDGAVNCYNYILELDPNNPEAKKGISGN